MKPIKVIIIQRERGHTLNWHSTVDDGYPVLKVSPRYRRLKPKHKTYAV